WNTWHVDEIIGCVTERGKSGKKLGRNRVRPGLSNPILESFRFHNDRRASCSRRLLAQTFVCEEEKETVSFDGSADRAAEIPLIPRANISSCGAIRQSVEGILKEGVVAAAVIRIRSSLGDHLY